MSRSSINSMYEDQSAMTQAVAAGQHREVIGGLWDEIGQLQFEYLVREGLSPEDSLLDIGCGTLRGGVRFVSYLDAGNYFGFDFNESLIQAGYEKEIVPAGLADRLPREQLVSHQGFDLSAFGKQFRWLLAFSLYLRTCP